MIRSTLKLLIIAALVGCGSEGTDVVDDENDFFNFLDVDRDGLLDEDEFRAGLDDSGTFDGFDANNDGLLDEDELEDVDLDMDFDFDELDVDTNDVLDEDEFGAGVFDRVDADQDGFVDDAEFAADDETFFSDLRP